MKRFAVLAFILVAPSAFAGYVDYTGKGLGQSIEIGGIMNDTTVYAGVLNAKYYKDGKSSKKYDNYQVFCADLSKYAGDGLASVVAPVDFDAIVPGANPAEDAPLLAAWLYDNYANEAVFNPTGSNSDKKRKAAALQLAIWEVLTEDPENGYSLIQDTETDFYVRFNKDSKDADKVPDIYNNAYDEIIGYANAWLLSLPTNITASDVNASFIADEDYARQSFIVPEPATIAMLSLGLLGLARRKK